ncbi:MAG: acyl-CoA dehydrogenase [Actinomycetota bacterium]
MDFHDSPEEAAFRKEVREWLSINLPKEWTTAGLFSDLARDDRVAVMREWQRRLYEGGWAGLNWPKEYGGRGASLMEQVAFMQEMARAKAPSPLGAIGIGMAGPTIIAHGTEAQKKRYVANILSGEEIWCQGFSEPGAGSDLGSLRTSAVLDGDHYIVNGQKVWTSVAHLADWCILLARTDPAAPKHGGITYFLMDMHDPGVEVRPLRQITGHAEFNEMFLTDVRIPTQNVLGEVNDGWRVAMTTLLHERGTLGFALAFATSAALDDLIEHCKTIKIDGKPAIEDPIVRQKLAQFHIEAQANLLNNFRAISTMQKTGIPGPEGSLSKLMFSETMQQITKLAVEIEGGFGLLDGSDTPDKGRWQYAHLRARGHSIEAGTSEILRNIIAERVLGLPKHK